MSVLPGKHGFHSLDNATNQSRHPLLLKALQIWGGGNRHYGIIGHLPGFLKEPCLRSADENSTFVVLEIRQKP